MGPFLVVVPPPCFDLRLAVGDRRALMHVQALVAQLAVEGFDVHVLDGTAGMDEIELGAALPRPVFERPAHELRPVIDGDRLRHRPSPDRAIQRAATVRPDMLDPASRIGPCDSSDR